MLTDTYNSNIFSLALDKIYQLSTTYSSNLNPLIDVGLGASVGFNQWHDDSINLDQDTLRQVNVYAEPSGELSLRKYIQNHYQKHLGIELSLDRIMVTNGASEALLLAFMILLSKTKNKLILPEFHYPCYKLLAAMLGKRFCFAAADSDYNCSIESVAASISKETGAIVINSPSNPFGKIIDTTRLQALCKLDIPIIADETYRLLSFEKQSPSLLSVSQQHFVINSFSKSLAMPGLRLGYLIVPESYIEQTITFKLGLNISTSIASQILGCKMIENRLGKLPNYSKYLRQNRDLLVSKCRQHGIKLACSPEAGIFAVLDTSKYGSSVAVAERLLMECGVLCAPMSDFRQPDPGFIRINYSCSAEQLDTVLDRIVVNFSNTHRKNHFIPTGETKNEATHNEYNRIVV